MEKETPVFNKEKFRRQLQQSIADTITAEARNLGISKQYLSNILKGRQMPARELLFSICRRKGIDIDSLST